MTKSSLVRAVALLLLSSSLASAQNVVPNANFDDGAAQWTVNGSPMPSSLLDATTGSPAAPSFKLSLLPGGGGGAWVESACVNVDSNQRYDLTVDLLIAAFSTGSVSAYAGAGCAGQAVFSSSIPLGSDCPTVAGGWRRCFLSNFALPAGAVSAKLEFSLFRGAGSAGSLQFDNLRFGPVGTVPVSLQSFAVD